MRTWIAPEREFAYLTWKQVEAIEQHGHHLPLATDTLLANLLLGKALDRLPAEAPIYALPTVCYGKSNEHIGFPGTMSVSATTFMAVVRDIGASVAASGFKRLVLYNAHGGNTQLVDVMARDLRAEFGLRTFWMGATGGAKMEGLSRQESTYGFHAGELETAWLLSAVPELVHSSEYTANYIADVEKPGVLRPEFGPANFAWLTRDIAPSGVMGDPGPATAENGAKWIEAAATGAASALQAMLDFEEIVKA
jgi:creatinine amidohydrolase